MADLDFPPLAIQAQILLTHYGFELESVSSDEFIDRWLGYYPASWLRAAVVESLYQGRYKAKSVEQILALWARRDRPLRHFNHEFESIICRELPYPEFTAAGLGVLPTETHHAESEAEWSLDPIASATATIDTESSVITVTAAAIGPDPECAATRLDPNGSLITLGTDHALPVKTEPIPPFAPQLQFDVVVAKPKSTAELAELNSAPSPIDEFIPTADRPQDHAKLQAVAPRSTSAEGGSTTP